MMKVTVYGEKLGIDRLDLADELEEQWRPEALLVAGEVGDMATAEVQRLVRIRAGTARTAAPAGAPPEQDSGEYARSIKRIPPRVKGRIASSGVQTDHPAGPRLEWGATDVRGIRTFPHPHFRPAMQNIEAAVDAKIQQRLG